ncbi:hypothetical protein HD554DRAFT_2177667 [Boletus coccyginus]|nr:hypothetical protein HD554DRAFT_2177667 [Boletus coccyginus]
MPDGIYKIRNIQCSEYVELDGDNPLGPICVRKDGSGSGNEWIIKKVGSSGSTLQNVRTRTYAYADQVPGAPLHGSETPMVWHWNSSDNIQSPDSSFIWELPSCDGCIIVVPPSAKGNIVWLFERVGDLE